MLRRSLMQLQVGISSDALEIPSFHSQESERHHSVYSWTLQTSVYIYLYMCLDVQLQGLPRVCAVRPVDSLFCGHLAVQCASWTRRCALGAPPLSSSVSTHPVPSPPPLHLQPAPKPHNKQRGHSFASVIATETTPPPPPLTPTPLAASSLSVRAFLQQGGLLIISLA